ncbi:similar to Saccharomyces cerevisiae YBR003W COQ1 Hexaprenyl pyrophosphate synthetase, catalyzes the first step in ubiquinone (coenzyme Q) biosynthesis [Maudiozyma barnettii]|uniref:Similar to Saccharomyces cerevisiae YBR003W COQ1 Hexaprenyl pyrophosphate synthetase, catalyzes the first step in ubiquinone (Coenzyme Q) biosynthesis n=1 Tax=Maudiozyma barnettii TaxID=61262 RepID=A0A8H2VD93_9SACH|nr:trans-hexaprenyltranstransferase [Kazachstania barnettii]CAB4253161.1 similar to Saccharomyces cerevisiae YBR003W COQ1 Hexaprenyl pyrophosphate synthetase, catalyzes the first step in ubiquinone (coenzyme Q) biosynthesis [Kazachstania barnettii]CAD1780303.1 similar to Saccharomyces cerevisiae YBR003W COQ1 Hexaprenyl pyrophosphate synthetase, catalyzes the first step in ubiquinone (coenzyme Q) biosynthesis [Kazachstania barnettii]
MIRGQSGRTIVRRLLQRRYQSKSSFGIALATASRLVTPKWMLNNPVSLVSTEMNTLAKNIMGLIGSGHPTLNHVTSYYFEAEGKKVRPMLVLLLSRAVSAIPIEKRNNIKIDFTDFETVPVGRDPLQKFLASKPVENFSPLQIIHGIQSMNPLTKEAAPIPEKQFDNERGILPKQRRLAEIVEMIHTASLLHDDVIDHADTRRGRPSGNVAFTNKMAVLAGDFLLGRATVSISRLKNPEVVELMSSSIANLVEGEFMQLHNVATDSGNNDLLTETTPIGKLDLRTHDYKVPVLRPPLTTTRDGMMATLTHEQQQEIINNAFRYYLHKSYLKTASLISKSCRATAILSGAQPEVIESCYNFGKNLGLCFQLVDDMLDFTVSAKELGKPSGADLKLGISTAPVLYAWKEDPSLGPLIQRHFSQQGDIQQVLKSVELHDGVGRTKKLAENYRDMALKCLRDVLPESDSRSALEFLTNSILTRRK